MKKMNRIFLGICFGAPMDIVGMTIGVLLAVIFDEIEVRCKR